jgi:hypothetical protein
MFKNQIFIYLVGRVIFSSLSSYSKNVEKEKEDPK